MTRWYLVHTKPSNEAIAQTNLSRQGYEVYLPRLIGRARRLTGWCERIAPLFPRYLFLKLNEGEQSLAPVRSSVGVSGVVRFGSRYAVVPDRIVNELQARADPESGLHRLTVGPRLLLGSAVRIVAGAFEGFDGIFEREAGDDRVIVLLKLLGQDASVGICSGFVVPTATA